MTPSASLSGNNMSDAPDQARAIRHSLNEITRNVLEHARGAPAFVCAQYYKKAGRVSIGVADCGCGIKESLSNNCNLSSDREAVIAALKPHVTGARYIGMYGATENAGAGLFYTRSLAKISGEYFAIVSGNTAYRLRRRQPESLFFYGDPTHERHDLWDSLLPWKGTIVAIDIGIREFDYTRAMDLIGQAFNAPPAGRAQSRKRPAIKFT